jgi:hypothetical protein
MEHAGESVLCSRAVNDVTNIWEYRISNASLKQLTSGAGPDLSPMPAGSKGIYFVNGRRAGLLTAYHPKTKQSVDLTSEDGTQPTISWDGRHLMYITLTGNAQQSDLWVSDIDARNKVKIASGTELFTLAFTSDASKLVYEVTEAGTPKTYIVKAGTAPPRDDGEDPGCAWRRCIATDAAQRAISRVPAASTNTASVLPDVRGDIRAVFAFSPCHDRRRCVHRVRV